MAETRKTRNNAAAITITGPQPSNTSSLSTTVCDPSARTHQRCVAQTQRVTRPPAHRSGAGVHGRETERGPEGAPAHAFAPAHARRPLRGAVSVQRPQRQDVRIPLGPGAEVVQHGPDGVRCKRQSHLRTHDMSHSATVARRAALDLQVFVAGYSFHGPRSTGALPTPRGARSSRDQRRSDAGGGPARDRGRGVVAPADDGRMRDDRWRRSRVTPPRPPTRRGPARFWYWRAGATTAAGRWRRRDICATGVSIRRSFW